MSLVVHVWSDIACPWCYVGKRRLDAALRSFGNGVSVQWHSFELDPGARPRQEKSEYVSKLANKYKVPTERAQAMIDNMTAVGEAEGIVFDFARAVPANTFDAHRLTHLAADRRLQHEMEERLFRAHFCEGIDLADRAALAELAGEVGIDVEETAALLASDRYADDVKEDEEQARALGVTGVPFFVIGRYGVAGAQPAAQLLKVLDRANLESDEPPAGGTAEGNEGAFCGPSGC